MGENPLASDLDHVLEHTRDLWEELRGERIFLTGGTGFFGCWLLESLLWARNRLGLGVEAVVLTRNPAAFRSKAPHLAGSPGVSLLRGDVRSFAFPSGHFSHVVHAASEPSDKVNNAESLEMLDIILQGTRHTLEFARHAGAGKLLFASSGAVYGNPAGRQRISETDCIVWPAEGKPDLQTVYREGKLIAELECALFAQSHDLIAAIARGFAFVGPYLPLDRHFAVGNFIRDGLEGGPIRVMGDGSPFRSYLYGADLAIWLWTILFRGQSGQRYNVGSETEVSIAGLASIVARLTLPHPEVQIALPADPGRTPESYVPSTERARGELGLEVWVGLEPALQRTIQWHREGRSR